MPTNLPEPLKSKLAARLAFYEDLGLGPFYRTRSAFVGASRVGGTAPQLGTQVSPQMPIPPKTPSLLDPFPNTLQKNSNFFDQLERVENDSLLKIRDDIGDCTRCRLHKTRRHIVFADGNPKAQLVFVGEGPGADEDATGIPFVGRAGKLLTQMIQAMGLQREDVYICNVVKCRPPENRQPQPDEVATCGPYLVRQLEVVNPKVIVCLGATAAQTLLETTTGISKFRGQWQDFRGKKLLATYHPAYLLRNPSAKSEVWKDLQKVMAELGLEVKKSKSS
jgi:uracil-DNA glycosylase family 4